MKQTDGKKFWRQVKNKKNNSCKTSLNDLFEHFKSLNEEGDHFDFSGETLDINMEYDLDLLNAPISENEILSVVKQLRNGKASGDDFNENVKTV